jgi:two-component system CheB/CheR fusion protein
VIVGLDLRIRRFTAAAEKILNFVAADVGRPLGYLGGVVQAARLEQIVGDAIHAASSREQRVRCADGLWYTMRVAPYRTSDHAIRGAIIELLRAPPLRRLGEPAEVHELVGKVLSTLPNALLLLDDQLRVVWANKQFFDTFQVGAEALGHPLEELWASREQHPDLWSRIETTASDGEPFRGVRVSHPFGRPEDRPMMFSAHRIPGDAERPAMVLMTMEEIVSKP